MPAYTNPRRRRPRRRRRVVPLPRRRMGRRKYTARASRNRGRLSARMIGFPLSNTVSMRYSAPILINLGAVGFRQFSFRANSIFDPDVDPAVSAKPLGYDQWNQFYERYVVLGSRITLSLGSSSAGQNSIICGVFLSDAPSTTATTSTALIEQGLTNYQIMSPTTNGLWINKSVTMNYSAKKYHGVVDVDDAAELEADWGANPADQTYFIVFASTYDSTQIGGPNITGVLTIDYIVRAKDPKELLQSV